MLLKDTRILITGVGTTDSIAWHVARIAQEEGAEVVLSTPDRYRPFTEQAAAELPRTPDVLRLDVLEEHQFDELTEALRERWGGLDGALHAIAYAPKDALGGAFMETSCRAACRAFEVSCFSYKELARALLPLFKESPGQSSLVGLDFDATVAWPIYDWMGVAKAGLEAANRYLAKYLGPHDVRVNLIASGPLQTVSARSIPGFETVAAEYERQTPLGWDWTDPSRTARVACLLLSNWTDGMTGGIVHVDGGFRALGAPLDVVADGEVAWAAEASGAATPG